MFRPSHPARASTAFLLAWLLLWQSALSPALATARVDVTQSVNALNQVSSSKSDELGRGWKTLDAKNHLTTSIYDAAGRATTTLLHDGTQMRSSYDSVA